MKQGNGQKIGQGILHAESVGAMVPELLARPAPWQVVQRYRHCCYCRDSADQLLCIADKLIGKGPFTIVCPGIGPLLGRELTDGCHASAGRLVWPGLTIDSQQAEIWSATFAEASPGGALTAEAFLTRDLSALAEEATKGAPREGYGSLIPAILGKAVSPRMNDGTAGLLHDHLFRILAFLPKEGENVPPSGRLASVLTPLIGVGYGLTPSGDDFCAGFLLGLVRMGRSKEASQVARALYRAARGRTTVVSLAGYRALAASQLTEKHARLVASFGQSDQKCCRAAVDGVGQSGATSGWDTLAGFAVGILTASPPSGIIPTLGGLPARLPEKGSREPGAWPRPIRRQPAAARIAGIFKG